MSDWENYGKANGEEIAYFPNGSLSSYVDFDDDDIGKNQILLEEFQSGTILYETLNAERRKDVRAESKITEAACKGRESFDAMFEKYSEVLMAYSSLQRNYEEKENSEKSWKKKYWSAQQAGQKSEEENKDLRKDLMAFGKTIEKLQEKNKLLKEELGLTKEKLRKIEGQSVFIRNFIDSIGNDPELAKVSINDPSFFPNLTRKLEKIKKDRNQAAKKLVIDVCPQEKLMLSQFPDEKTAKRPVYETPKQEKAFTFFNSLKKTQKKSVEIISAVETPLRFTCKNILQDLQELKSPSLSLKNTDFAYRSMNFKFF